MSLLIPIGLFGLLLLKWHYYSKSHLSQMLPSGYNHFISVPFQNQTLFVLPRYCLVDMFLAYSCWYCTLPNLHQPTSPNDKAILDSLLLGPFHSTEQPRSADKATTSTLARDLSFSFSSGSHLSPCQSPLALFVTPKFPTPMTAP